MPVAPMGDLGPCFVRWDSSGDNLDLNPTLGSVKIRDALAVRDIFTDQQGDTPVDGVDMGRITEIEVPMTEFSLTQLVEVIQGGSLAADKLTVSNTVGNRTYPLAKDLIIKPSRDNAASVTGTEFATFHHCFPVLDQELVYGKDDQRVVKVIFKVYPSQTTATLNEMGYYGE